MNNDYNNQQPNNQQPPYQQPPQPGKNLAIGSLVCGICSLVAICFGYGAFLGIVLGIVAVVLAINAKKRGFVGGMVTAGLVLGIIGAVLSAVSFVACIACVCVAGAAATSYSSELNDILNSLS